MVGCFISILVHILLRKQGEVSGHHEALRQLSRDAGSSLKPGCKGLLIIKADTGKADCHTWASAVGLRQWSLKWTQQCPVDIITARSLPQSGEGFTLAPSQDKIAITGGGIYIPTPSYLTPSVSRWFGNEHTCKQSGAVPALWHLWEWWVWCSGPLRNPRCPFRIYNSPRSPRCNGSPQGARSELWSSGSKFPGTKQPLGHQNPHLRLQYKWKPFRQSQGYYGSKVWQSREISVNLLESLMAPFKGIYMAIESGIMSYICFV